MSQKGRLLFGSACVLLISLAGLFFVIQTWMPFMWFVLGPAVLSILGYIYLDRKIWTDFFTQKTTKHGLNMGALILIMLTFLVAFNVIATKKNKSFDFSSSQINTLSPLTLKILKNLDADVQVKFFYKEGSENIEFSRKAFAQLLKTYQEATDRIKIEYVEMNANPKKTLEFQATNGQGEAYLEYKGQKNRIEAQFAGQLGQKYQEQDFTNALIKVSRKEKKTIYFVEGHEEREIDNEKTEQGASALRQLLEKNSYVAKKLNLIQAAQIPKEASVLVILGPKTNYQKFEIELLKNYLTSGGSVFIALDDKLSAGLNPLLDLWGLKLDQQYVFNILNSQKPGEGQIVNSGQPTVAVDFSSTSEITKVFTTNQNAIFLKPNSLSVTSTSNNIKTEVILKTPAAAVALKNLDSETYEGQPQAFNLAAESSGKLTAEAKIYKAVVFADADFLSNVGIFQTVNRDLFLNSIASLTNDTDLISISPKEPQVTKLLMTPPEFTQFYKFSVLGLILPIPFLFLIASVVLWLKRRHA